jgi:hypothetical protein
VAAAPACLARALILVYRADGVSGWIQIRPYWWGILGLIGWAYLVAARPYLLAGDRPRSSWAVALLYLVALATRRPIAPLRAIRPSSLWRAMLGAHGALVLSGAVLGRALGGIARRRRRALRLRARSASRSPRAAAGLLLHALHGVHPGRSRSARSARPRPGASSPPPGTVAAWTALYASADVAGHRRWPRAIAMAGENAPAIYLLAPFLLSVFELIAGALGRESVRERSAGRWPPGSSRSVVFAWVGRALSGWMRARGLRCSSRGGRVRLWSCPVPWLALGCARAVAQPLVLVNHVGYDVAGPKRAIVPGPLRATAVRVLRGPGRRERTRGPGRGPRRRAPSRAGATGRIGRPTSPRCSAKASSAVACTTGGGAVPRRSFGSRMDVLERQTLSDVLYYFKGQRASVLLDQATGACPLEGRSDRVVDAHGAGTTPPATTAQHLSHLSYSTYFNPQQIPLTAWGLLEDATTLQRRSDPLFRQYLRRLLDEAAWGADYLVRVQAPGGSFYRSVSGAGTGKRPEDRRIGRTRRAGRQGNEDQPAFAGGARRRS